MPLVSATIPSSDHTLVTNRAIFAPLAPVIVPRSGATAAPPASASTSPVPSPPPAPRSTRRLVMRPAATSDCAAACAAAGSPRSIAMRSTTERLMTARPAPVRSLETPSL